MQQRPKAYLFDVFGTVVNWRHSLAKGLEASARKYQRYINSDARPQEKGDRGTEKATFIPQEELHRRNLDTLISEFRLDGLWTTSEQTDQLRRLWHELDAWPDSAAAIARFAKLGPAAALSDGSVALLNSLDARNGLGFTEVWGSDTWRAYKPDPSVYLGAVKKLGLEPGDVALVAAHLGDLWGGRRSAACGRFMWRGRLRRGIVRARSRRRGEGSGWICGFRTSLVGGYLGSLSSWRRWGNEDGKRR
ncbi:hypothetical protein PG993_011252 [Apiospora rasikravindrae]|uniref:Haloacid dehalogenase n=1 Tax=Apiospora rasikravindrae TaxID=990691 RepID=A0ABR1SDP8_9PEZI